MLSVSPKDAAGRPDRAERELTAFQETLAVLQDQRASINRAIEQIDRRN
jgi:hypothetical protein